MDCVSLLTERFYTPLLGSNREPINKESFEEDPLNRDLFEEDPFGSPLQPALLMPLPPKGIYPLFEELYSSIQAFAKEH
jgi:hypothetical protein